MGEPFADVEQLPLGPTFHYAAQGARLREMLNRAIARNGVSYAELEHETGIDERQIARCLREDGGAHPPLALVACILGKDRQGIAITGLAAMLGYEARPKVDPWDRIRKLEAKIARLEAALAEEP